MCNGVLLHVSLPGLFICRSIHIHHALHRLTEAKSAMARLPLGVKLIPTVAAHTTSSSGAPESSRTGFSAGVEVTACQTYVSWHI